MGDRKSNLIKLTILQYFLLPGIKLLYLSFLNANNVRDRPRMYQNQDNRITRKYINKSFTYSNEAKVENAVVDIKKTTREPL